jgi:ribosomal protein S19
MKNIQSWENFTNEGRIYKTIFTENQKEAFRDKVKSHVKSQDCTTKQVGNDLEVSLNGDHIVQVMFRDDYVGVKKQGTKFTDEFEYTQFGDIKKALSKIIKDCK